MGVEVVPANRVASKVLCRTTLPSSAKLAAANSTLGFANPLFTNRICLPATPCAQSPVAENEMPIWRPRPNYPVSLRPSYSDYLIDVPPCTGPRCTPGATPTPRVGALDRQDVIRDLQGSITVVSDKVYFES